MNLGDGRQAVPLYHRQLMECRLLEPVFVLLLSNNSPLHPFSMTSSRLFIGLANGSGGEGADAVLVETTGVGLQLRARVIESLRRKHHRDVQELFLKTMPLSCSASLADLTLLHRQLGENAGQAALQLIAATRIEMARVMAIGHMGPLAWHEPSRLSFTSLEIGQASAIVEKTGLTVIDEFRERDIAAGGQGMPITSIADWAFFRDADQGRLLVHLGGITSFVYIPAHARPQDVLAFEIGPGTRLLDAIIRQGSSGRERFDVGGKHAVQGKCLDGLLAKWLEHPYLQQRPPKSLSRTEFGVDWIARAARAAVEVEGKLEDFLCTLSHFLVRSIVLATRWLPAMTEPVHLWLSGGGTRNGLFWRLLEQEMPGVVLHRLDELGVPSQARQAAGAALLAALAMDGVPASSPGVTGAVGRLLGKMTPGEGRSWARCLRWMAEQSTGELTSPYKAA